MYFCNVDNIFEYRCLLPYISLIIDVFNYFIDEIKQYSVTCIVTS